MKEHEEKSFFPTVFFFLPLENNRHHSKQNVECMLLFRIKFETVV